MNEQSYNQLRLKTDHIHPPLTEDQQMISYGRNVTKPSLFYPICYYTDQVMAKRSWQNEKATIGSCMKNFENHDHCINAEA